MLLYILYYIIMYIKYIVKTEPIHVEKNTIK